MHQITEMIDNFDICGNQREKKTDLMKKIFKKIYCKQIVSLLLSALKALFSFNTNFT